jgi:hypothetical protein
MSVTKHWLLSNWYPWRLIFPQQRYRPSDSNKNVDIYCSGQYEFLENHLSGMLKVKRLEMRRKPWDLIENELLQRHKHYDDGRLELSSHKLGFCNSVYKYHDNEIQTNILAIAASFQLTEIHDLQTEKNNLLDIVLLVLFNLSFSV